MAKPALGRGLGALLGGESAANKKPVPTSSSSATSSRSGPAAASAETGANREGVQYVPLDRIQPCPFQPRKDFPAEALQELADSIRQQGIVQPLMVRVRGEGYELIAGERRWRAAQLLELTEVPVLVREADDRTVLALALIENLQRENLNPIEEAFGYSELMDQFELTQEEVASRVGKSRTAVANALRLLKLAPEVQEHVREDRLSVGHAKVILGLSSKEQQRQAVDRVLKEGMNVRQAEELVAHLQSLSPVGKGKNRSRSGAESKPLRDTHVMHLENQLKERLGTKVQLRYRQGKGNIDIRFYNDDDLERLLDLLGVKSE